MPYRPGWLFKLQLSVQGAGEIKKKVRVLAARVLPGNVFEKLPRFVGVVQVVVGDTEFGEHGRITGLFLLVLAEQGQRLGPAPVGKGFFAVLFPFGGFLRP